MLDYINEDKCYVLLPKYEEGVENRPRGMTGAQLLETFGEKAQSAFSAGTMVVYKGNEYFIDEAI